MNKQNKSQKLAGGFTLIELLVVIAIIGLLSSIIIVALYNARAKGRDSRRVGDMTQMGSAMELYYNTNRGYPSAVSGVPQGMTPTVTVQIPTSPVPGDGNCDSLTNPAGQAANPYYYVPTGSSTVVGGVTVWSDYAYYFCIGNQTGDHQPGVRTLTPKGIR